MSDRDPIPNLRRWLPWTASLVALFAALVAFSNEEFVRGSCAHQMALRLCSSFLGLAPNTWTFSTVAEISFLFLSPGTIAGLVLAVFRDMQNKPPYCGAFPVFIAALLMLPLKAVMILTGTALHYFIFVPIIWASLPYSIIAFMLGRPLWRFLSSMKASLAIALALLATRSSFAWENTKSHPVMVDRGIDVVDRERPGEMLELDAYRSDMKTGTTREDDSFSYQNDPPSDAAIVTRHFHNPGTSRANKGLRTLSPTFGPFQDSLDRAALVWSDALSLYKLGQKKQAYNALGHVAHLATQDMTQPAHVHDDPHLPHILFGDGETIETVLAALNPDTIIPNNLASAAPANSSPLTAAAVRAFGEEVSGLTYGPSRFLGFVTVGGDPETIGLPAGDVSPTFVAARESDPNPNLNDDHFEIGTDAPLYYHPAIRGDIVSSSLDQDWWELPNSPGDSEEDPGNHWFYIDRMERVITNAASGERLDLYFIKSFVPLSVSYTAGLFKAAGRAFDSVKPTVELLAPGGGTLILPGGWTSGAVFIRATDPGGSEPGGDPAYPTPSGIYKMELRRIQPASLLLPNPAIPLEGENPAQRFFSPLAQGEYEAKAFDGLGNVSDPIRFNVDSTAPRISTAAGASSRYDLAADKFLTDITVEATDDASGLKSLELFMVPLGGSFDPNAPAAVSAPISEGQLSVSHVFSGLSDGSYQVKALDRAGNVRPLNFVLFTGNMDAMLFGDDSTTENIVKTDCTSPPDVPTALTACNSTHYRLPISADRFAAQGTFSTITRDIGIKATDALGVSITPGNLLPGGAVLDSIMPPSPFQVIIAGSGALRSFPPNCGQLGVPNQVLFEVSFALGSSNTPAVSEDVLAPATVHFFKTPNNGTFQDSSMLLSPPVPLNRYVRGAVTFKPNPSPILTELICFNQLGQEQSRTTEVVIEAAGLGPAMFFAFNSGFQNYTDIDRAIPFFLFGREQRIDWTGEFPIAPNTPLGTNITLALQGDVTVQYAEVIAEGHTTIDLLPPALPFPYLSGFRAFPAGSLPAGQSSIFDLFTTANSRGAITITIPYSDAGLSLAQEQSLRLFHLRADNSVQDVTTFIDTVLNRIVATVDSFSVFAMAVIDDIPPAAIVDLAASQVNSSSIILSWTAPGDDGMVGRSQSYDMRFAVAPINEGNFQSASRAPNPPMPQFAGIQQSMAVSSLSPSTTYYFAIKTIDQAGNVSALSNIASAITHAPAPVLGPDTTPPDTVQFFLGPASFDETNRRVVSSMTAIGLSIVDPAGPNHQVSGGSVTLFAVDPPVVDTNTFAVFAATFTLAEGTHTIAAFSIDRAGNVGAVRVEALGVDGTPPETQLVVFGASRPVNGLLRIGPNSTVGFNVRDPPVASVSAGAGETHYLVDVAPESCPDGLPSSTPDETAPIGTCSNPRFRGPFSLTLGTHTVFFASLDRVLNRAPWKQQEVEVAIFDTLPPRTSLAVGYPQAGFIVSSMTLLGLVAIDDHSFFGDGTGEGVRETFLAVDSSSFQVFTASFTLQPPDGLKTTRFFSVDVSSNVEEVKVSTLALDSTPPSTQLSLSDSFFSETSTRIFVRASHTLVGFGAFDIPGGSLSAGVARTLFLLDSSSGPFQQFDQPFTLFESIHPISFSSEDRVGNIEAVQSAEILADGTAPETEVLVFGSSRAVDGRLQVDLDSQISLNVRDPPVNDVAAGPAETHYLVDAAPESCPGGSPAEITDPGFLSGTCENSHFGGPFVLNLGTHSIYFSSLDRVQNREAWKSREIEVLVFDTKPPRTSLVIGGPRFGFSPVIVSSRTPLGFTAVDDLRFTNDGAGAGIRKTSYAIGASSFQVFTSSFTLSPPDGFYPISFFSVDFSSNSEQVRVSTVALDATPPTARLAFQGNVFLNDQNQLLVRAGDTFVSFVSSDPLVNGVSAGSTRTFFLVGDFVDPLSTPFREFAQPFTLSEGTYAVRTFAIDRVGNRGGVLFRTILANGTPPTTELVVLGSSNVVNGETLIQQGTLLTLMAKDPVSGGVSSGVGGVFFLIDISPDLCPDVGEPDPTKPPGTCENFIFPGPFSLGIGTHTVYWASVDNVQNEEDVKSARITVLSPVEVSLKIKPHRINLKSQGRKITAIFKIPGPRTAKEIDPDSVRITAINDQRLADPLEPLGHQKAGKGKEIHEDDGEEDETDWDEEEKKDDREHGNGTDRLKLKFDRQELIAVLPLGEQVKVTTEGRLFDGTPFTAFDFVKTINPGKIKAFESGAAFHPATGAKVQVPQGALPSDTDITVLALGAEPEEDKAKQEEKAQYRRLKLVGKPYEFEPEGTRFTVPATITLPYDPKALDGSDPKTLKIAYWNPKTNDWEPLASTVDLAQRTVSAQTDHFSHYQITGGGGGSPGPGVQGVQDAFGLIEAYAFPSPAYPGQRPTIRAQVGLADSVSVNVYDISGQLVHSAGFGVALLLDDGNGKGQQWTYDYAWDVSGVGSGVYIMAVTAKKSGQADIKVTKKLGVIK